MCDTILCWLLKCVIIQHWLRYVHLWFKTHICWRYTSVRAMCTSQNSHVDFDHRAKNNVLESIADQPIWMGKCIIEFLWASSCETAITDLTHVTDDRYVVCIIAAPVAFTTAARQITELYVGHLSQISLMNESGLS